METVRQFKRPCAYCGTVPQRITADHVPPTALLLKPYPRRITVPACHDCNNKFSRTLEQDFGIFVSMWVGMDDEQRRRLWKEKALPMIRSDRRKWRAIVNSMQPAARAGADGTIEEIGHAIKFDADLVRTAIKRLVRGLYYHAYKRVLPPHTPISADLIDRPDEHEAAFARYTVGINLGDQFKVAHGRTDDDLDTSVWLFRFYNGLFAAAYTGQAAGEEAQAVALKPVDGVLVLPMKGR